MSETKKARDFGEDKSNIQDEASKTLYNYLTGDPLENVKKTALNIMNSGFGCTNLIEPVPNYIVGACEEVIKGKNNSWIILGRDRPSSLVSGYGGAGHTQAASIDIVVGRMGHRATKKLDDGETPYVNPSFRLDAARIYISQKTDIDSNFGIVAGKLGISKERSAIALSADAIRLASREGIKLVTNISAENSQGGNNSSVFGIDLIAGNNDSDMQPIPKGDNLAEALETVVKNLDNLAGIVETFIAAQMSYNSALAGHTHLVQVAPLPVPPIPTFPDPVIAISGVSTSANQLINDVAQMPVQRINTAMFKAKYLKPFGDKYINSSYNSTN